MDKHLNLEDTQTPFTEKKRRTGLWSRTGVSPFIPKVVTHSFLARQSTKHLLFTWFLFSQRDIRFSPLISLLTHSYPQILIIQKKELWQLSFTSFMCAHCSPCMSASHLSRSTVWCMACKKSLPHTSFSLKGKACQKSCSCEYTCSMDSFLFFLSSCNQINNCDTKTSLPKIHYSCQNMCLFVCPSSFKSFFLSVSSMYMGNFFFDSCYTQKLCLSFIETLSQCLIIIFLFH